MIKVVLADDHAIVRDGVRAVLERKGKDMEVVAEIANGKDLVEWAGKNEADVYVVDIGKRVSFSAFQVPARRLTPNRSNQAASAKSRLKDRTDHMRDTGFSVCSGYADDLQLFRWMTVPRVIQTRYSSPRILRLQINNTLKHRIRCVRFGQNTGGTARYRIGNISMPIGMQAANANE